MSYETVVKRHLCPRCTIMKGQGGIDTVIPMLSGVPGPVGHMRPSEHFSGLRELFRLHIILQTHVLYINKCRSRLFSKLQLNTID